MAVTLPGAKILTNSTQGENTFKQVRGIAIYSMRSPNK